MRRKADLEEMKNRYMKELEDQKLKRVVEEKKKKKFRPLSAEQLEAERRKYTPTPEERALAAQSPSLRKMISNAAAALGKSKITLPQFTNYVVENLPKEFEAVVKTEYSNYRKETPAKSPLLVRQFIEREIKAFNRKEDEAQRELSKSGKVVLIEGQDDTRIDEFREMLQTILNQPGDDKFAKKERSIAKSILGDDVKTAGLLDSLKPKEKKEKEPIYFTKEDFSEDELVRIEENLLEQMAEKTLPQGFPGWRRTDVHGRTVYVLSKPQINMISYLFENALMRVKGENPIQVRRERRKAKKEEQEKRHNEEMKEKKRLERLREETKRKKETPGIDLTDEDLDNLDFDDLDEVTRSASLKRLIKSARSLIKRIKI